LLQRPFVAVALNLLGFFTGQDRPSSKVDVKLAHGANEQASFMPLLSLELVRCCLYPPILIALSTPFIAIKTNVLISVTAPLTTTLLRDLAVLSFTIPEGQSSTRPV
jgi:hypothetical protein